MGALPDDRRRRLRWLPLLLLAWIGATWYVETRVDRLVASDANLLADGDFSSGVPGGPRWEYAGIAGDLWQPSGGIDGGGALRLGGPGAGLLRYRLPDVWRADGYHVGLCARTDGDGVGVSTRAWVEVRRAGIPRLGTPPATLIEAPVPAQWHCALQAIAVPFGLDELVLQVEVPAGTGYLWVDRVTIRPAVNPPAYRLGQAVLVAGWLMLGGLSLVAAWRGLGGAGAAVVVVTAVAAGAVALAGTEDWFDGALVVFLETPVRLLHGLADPVLEAVRIFSGDRSWRLRGTTDVIAAAALLLAGFIAAWAVMLRYRWTARPWGRTLVWAAVAGLAVPALRLLLHLPAAGNLHWVLDPLAVVAGVTAGAAVAETLLRLLLRRAL